MKKLKLLKKKCNIKYINLLAISLYDKGYNAINILDCLKKLNIIDYHKLEYLFNNIKPELRDEAFAIKYILILYYFRLNKSIENMILM